MIRPALLLALLALGGCKHAPSCRADKGMVLLLEPKTGSPKSLAPSFVKALEGIPYARAVASDHFVAVFITDATEERAQAVKDKVLPVAHAENLELQIEDTATIDDRCNIRRAHDPELIAPSP